MHSVRSGTPFPSLEMFRMQCSFACGPTLHIWKTRRREACILSSLKCLFLFLKSRTVSFPLPQFLSFETNLFAAFKPIFVECLWCGLPWLPSHNMMQGFTGGASGKKKKKKKQKNPTKPACQCKRSKRHRFNPRVREIPRRRAWQSTPVFLPEESHGQRSLAGCSSWDCKEHAKSKSTFTWGCKRMIF